MQNKQDNKKILSNEVKHAFRRFQFVDDFIPFTFVFTVKMIRMRQKQGNKYFSFNVGLYILFQLNKLFLKTTRRLLEF